MIKRINLYQAAFRPPSVALPARQMLLSGAVFIIGLLALYAWDGWQLRRLQQQVVQVGQQADAITRQVEASSPGARQIDPDLAMRAAALEARVRAMQLAQDAIANGAVGSAQGYAAQFRALSRVVGNPATHGAWLTRIALFDNGRAMDLQGRTLSGAEAARLIGNLRREPLFVGLSFASLQVAPPELKAPLVADASSAKPPEPPPFLVFSLNARPADATVAGSPPSGLASQPRGTAP